METSDFSVTWPDDDNEPIDIYAEPQSDQLTIKLEYYDQPVLDGLEEESVEQISVSGIPTLSVANRLLIAKRTHCGRQIG